MASQGVPVCCVLLLLCVCRSDSAQCTPHPDNLCKATCNGTTFDISTLFDYPLNISSGYWYMWDPCKGLECPGAVLTKNTAVCQKADQYYNCGLVGEPIWLFNYLYESVEFKIQYPWGTDWRISEFTFIVDKSQEEPTIEFMGEKPSLQYNFVIRGKCIGQPEYNECKYDKKN